MGQPVNISTGTLIRHGESIEVECDDNYELAANGPITCFNGTFSSNLKCEPARCKTLPAPPLNGMVVVPETKHGGVGLYQCKDGYDLKGSNITTCNYGNWSGETPRCELIYCEFPGYVKGGKVCIINNLIGYSSRVKKGTAWFQVLLVGNMGLYDYRPYVKKVINNRQIMFECGKNALLVDGPPGATCIAGKYVNNCISYRLMSTNPVQDKSVLWVKRILDQRRAYQCLWCTWELNITQIPQKFRPLSQSSRHYTWFSMVLYSCQMI